MEFLSRGRIRKRGREMERIGIGGVGSVFVVDWNIKVLTNY